MSNKNPISIEIESALDEEIVAAAQKIIPESDLVYGAGGELVGVTYYADETSKYYHADIDSLREAIEIYQGLDADQRHDAYSHWCAATAAKGYRTADAAESALLDSL